MDEIRERALAAALQLAAANRSDTPAETVVTDAKQFVEFLKDKEPAGE